MTYSRSTRTRLTLYFTAAFGVMVVCLAVASYSVFSHEAYRELDLALHVAASATAMSAAHELDEHARQTDGERDLESILQISARSKLRDTQILIRDAGRNVAYKQSRSSGADISKLPDQQLLNSAGVPGLRVVSTEIPAPKFNATYRIFAAGPTEPIISKLNQLRAILLVCVPLGLGLAALAGYILAQRSLAPLQELTQTIEAITSADLSARVHLRNPPSDFAWLASRFNLLLDRLEKAFHFQRQFMADASHELRTPLTVALSATQVTARDNRRTRADCDDTLSLVEEQILRLKGIVDNMLFLSQVDACRLNPQRREFFLDDTVSEAARAARTLARTKQQSLKIAELPEAACVGDDSLLKQALLILLDNAVKYTPVAGEISVTLSLGDRAWHCRVWNSGVPIPAEIQSRIFERFFRGSTAANEKVPGSGLGLPIARSIAEAHGGELNLVRSGPEGTTFELVLPCALVDSTIKNAGYAKSLAVKI